MGTGWKKDRKRTIELAATLVLAGIIVWQYGSLAPRVIIVLSFLLSIVLVLVQLPFLAGFYGSRRFRPALVVFLAVLPFLISWGYQYVYRKDLLMLFSEEWLGAGQSVVSVMAVIALPALAFAAGYVSRKYRRQQSRRTPGEGTDHDEIDQDSDHHPGGG
ncbi:MAG: hypothetical protein AABZ15_14125 [Nitrospirota bacterium]